MKHFLKRWGIFTASLALLAWALVLVSRTLLKLDSEQRQAARQTLIEEKTRLALWRMDSLLTPLIVEENARAHEAFQNPAAQDDSASSPAGVERSPNPASPWTRTSPYVLLHFQFEPDGRLASPPLQERPGRSTPPDEAASLAARLEEFRVLLNQESSLHFEGDSARQAGSVMVSEKTIQGAQALNRDILINQCSLNPTNAAKPPFVPGVAAHAGRHANDLADWEARERAHQEVQRAAWSGLTRSSAALFNAGTNSGRLHALWLGGSLVLASRAPSRDGFVVQGCWLDWPALRQRLLSQIHDLLPNARLQPVTQKDDADFLARLAALPVRLDVGAVPFPEESVRTSVLWSLGVAWIGFAVAGAAAAFLLHGTRSLSERRAMFVAAVSHELRTPLTTLKMYSEMLSDGMVKDPMQQQHYLQSLNREASRLGTLVENILAYSRLEHGKPMQRSEEIPVGGLLDRIRPRLEERARVGSMELVIEGKPAAMAHRLSVDVAAVEHILFNLVDNACKHGGSGASLRRVHIEAFVDRGQATLRVRDHGPGIDPALLGELFEPFHRSAETAARSAPGVGLGLALCRRLSRSMGGDLNLDAREESGAVFLLRLPSTAQPSGPAALD